MQFIPHVLALSALSHVLVARLVCMERATRHMSLMVLLSPSARTTLEKSRENGHVMAPSCSVALSSMYSTILADIGRHRSVRSFEAASVHMGLGAHVLILCLADHVLTIGHTPCTDHSGCLVCVGTLSHVICLGHAGHLYMYPLFHTSHVAGGPPEAAGGPRGPLLKNLARVAI